MARVKDVHRFLIHCITEVEADGHQQIDDINEVTNPHADKIVIPDDWHHDGKRSLSFMYDGTEFECIVIKKRPRNPQGA